MKKTEDKSMITNPETNQQRYKNKRIIQGQSNPENDLNDRANIRKITQSQINKEQKIKAKVNQEQIQNDQINQGHIIGDQFKEPNTEDKNNKQKIKQLLESKIGLYNAGGSCYMASIIQILIHLKQFLNIFLRETYKKNKPLSYLFYNFIEKLSKYDNHSIEIKYFANEYNKINYKFSGKHGNNPMSFFTEFIQQLNEENKENDILKLFMGKKYINFEGNEDLNYEEDFIFFLATLDEKNYTLKEFMYRDIEFEGDDTTKFNEKIIVKPEILIINLEIEDINYEFEETIFLDDDRYDLKAINRYTDFHSTA